MKVLSGHRSGGLTRTGRARAPGYTPETHSFEMLCEPHHTACDAASSVAPALGRAKNAAPRRVGFWTRARLCLSSPALAQTRHGAWLRACQRCLGGRSSIDASSATRRDRFMRCRRQLRHLRRQASPHQQRLEQTVHPRAQAVVYREGRHIPAPGAAQNVGRDGAPSLARADMYV